ncbi:hypothetical protein [Actinomadura rudentiformis]|uniref:Uncharacterized protein n=1 Tax=Actinomadura rudentiformis TaxID=359158 RepID=A0A6H9YZ35_9ACTN|nr:hypothetical protein [Actinomadura rudentiformis]KAB2347293.1 hypothetical protein F8566_19975 [Actinomadura rudentiformis]
MNGRIVSGAPEEVSIAGTAIAHIPLYGNPEVGGLRVDADGSAVIPIDDGALHIEYGDLATLDRWFAAITTARQRMWLHHHGGKEAA